MADSIPSYSASSYQDAPVPMGNDYEPQTAEFGSANNLARRLLQLGLILVVLGGLLAYLIPPAAHINDRYRLGLSPGCWIALAWTANNGEFYPPLHNDFGQFGGTRYMPVPIGLLATAAKISGEYVTSGKVVSFISTSLLLVVLMMMLRQLRCGWMVSFSLTSIVVMSQTGQEALTAIRCDALPTAIQLLALWLVTRSRSPGSIIMAALLCTFGVFTKLSAVWAAGAIGLWLLVLDRKALLLFVVSGLVSFALGFGLVHWITDGRFIENLTGLSVSGIRGKWAIAWWSPPRLLLFFTEWSTVVWTLMPMALLSLLWAITRRELTIAHLAFVVCGPIMIVLYADVGVGENHLIEPLALIVLLVGDLWARSATSPRQWTDLRCFIAMAIIAGGAASMLTRLWPEITRSIEILRTGKIDSYDQLDPLAKYITVDSKLLTEDPYLSVLHNQRPFVMDTFMLLRIDIQYPHLGDELIGRISKHEFDVIVLYETIDLTSWYFNEICFGPRIAKAIGEHYELVEILHGFGVYLPKHNLTLPQPIVTTQPETQTPASQPVP